MLRATRYSLLAIAGLMWVGTGSGRAQSLPKGEQVMDQFVEALGGQKLVGKFRNRLSEGTIQMSQGPKGEATIIEAAPNKMLVEFVFGTAKIREGTDGETAWSEDPSGAHLKKGTEKDAALREAIFNGELEWRKIYKTAECVGEEDVQGQPCYKVKLTTHDGRERTIDYDKKTHLAVKALATEESPTGKVSVETLLEDYRPVDGMLIPHRTKQKVGQQEFTIVFTKIEHNVDIPASRFALPAEVKKLKDKEAGGGK